MPVIHDEEFGKITIRRSARASQIRLRVAPDGSLRASLPLYAPTFLVTRLLKNSRTDLRQMIAKSKPDTIYTNGIHIGKSHSLVVRPSQSSQTTIARQRQKIIVQLSKGQDLNDPLVTRQLRPVIIAALRLEAKSYLPKRLAYWAAKLGYDYERVRFSHASGRWGSCSSSGTISLNIALMKLPFELIDYVLIHELAHTKQMNHSPDFWLLVKQADPDYKTHRQALKRETPTI